MDEQRVKETINNLSASIESGVFIIELADGTIMHKYVGGIAKAVGLLHLTIADIQNEYAQSGTTGE